MADQDWTGNLRNDTLRLPKSYRPFLRAVFARDPEWAGECLIGMAVCHARGGNANDGWIVGRAGKVETWHRLWGELELTIGVAQQIAAAKGIQ